MGEIRKLTEKKEEKPLKTLGGNSNAGKTTVVITNTPLPEGSVKPVVLDRNSPVEETQAEVHIHADRKSYKEALKKDD